ncbi:MAG: FG-GAP-like repeat-containing protein, partial [Candidatus Poseidoniaceae archaeon]|nr:FG-GAP-like repeat-containing protein [Candidatus Poseidoniaceae archaeon]
TGAHTPFTWSTSSTMPAGLSLSSSGVISGTPTNAGNNFLEFNVTDAQGSTVSKMMILIITNAASEETITVDLNWNSSSGYLESEWLAESLTDNAFYSVPWRLFNQATGSNFSAGTQIPAMVVFSANGDSSSNNSEFGMAAEGFSFGDIVCYNASIHDGSTPTTSNLLDVDEACAEITDGTTAIFNSTSDWTSTNALDSKSVAWGDVDGDGDLDLAAGDYSSNNEVYLNSGTALATTSDWTSGNSLDTESVAWGDVDGDGDLDLAVGNQDGTNEVYLNQLNDGGAGTDGLPDIDLGGPGPVIFNSNGDWNSSNSLWTYSVAWGDVDGDGDLDLAVGNADDSYGPSEVYSNGDGALASSRSWASDSNLDTRSVSWGDIDNDGDLDLAVGNFGDQNEIYLNTGSGLATTPTWTSTNSLQTYSLAWGDVDGDGDLDLAVGNDQANNEVYLNSNGEFATSADWTSENSLNTRVVVWVDVDSDGDLDLSVGNANGNNEIYVNSGTSLAAAPDWTSSNSLATSGVAWGDIDDDGHLDMIVANDGGSNELYLSNNGVLANTPAWTSDNALSSKSIALGDVDGDGDLDMAVGNYNQNNELYLYSNGAFTTTPVWTSATTQKTFSVAWGDVDGDGDLDLAIGEQQSKNQVYLNQLDSGGAGADGLPDIDLAGGAGDVVKQDITVGMHHSCGILSNGSAMCWGGNPDGQLGHGGGTADYYFPVEVDIPPGRTVVSISAGNFHTCAVLDDGKAMCWGNGYDGRLGNGNSVSQF